MRKRVNLGKRILQVFGLCFFFCLPGYANLSEKGFPYIINYGSREFQAEPQNFAAIQDKRGVVYFANGQGILEYDGQEWRLIQVSNQSHVSSFAMDKSGRIYVGASGEFGYLASDSQGALGYRSLLNFLPEAERNFQSVWQTICTSHGIYFVAADRVFHYNNQKISIGKFSGKIHGYGLYDRLFIYSEAGGMACFFQGEKMDLPGCEAFNYPEMGNTIPLPYPENKIIFFSDRQGTFIYDWDKTGISGAQDAAANPARRSLSLLKKIAFESDQLLNQTGLSCGIRLTNGVYALGTWEAGILIVNEKGALQQIISKNCGLRNNSICALLEDRDDNVWVCTTNNISYIEASDPVTRFSDYAGLEDAVLAVARYHGQIFASTFGAVWALEPGSFSLAGRRPGFRVIDPVISQCFEFFPFRDFMLIGGQQAFLASGGGIFKLENTPSTYCFGQSIKFPNIIFLGCAHETSQGSLAYMEYRGPEQTGKNRPADPGQYFIFHKSFPEVSSSIAKITGDPAGNLWLSTFFDGVIEVRFKGKVSDFELVRYGRNKGLPAAKFNLTYIINNDLLAATHQGIFRLVRTDGNKSVAHRFQKDFEIEKSLHGQSDEFEYINIYDAQRLLISSYKTIGLLSMHGDHAFSWDTAPFQKINETCRPFVEPNGVIWFPTMNGLYRYDPAIKKDYHVRYPTLIRKVTAGSDQVLFSGYFPAPCPVLKFGSNPLVFEYAAPFYEHGSANRFSCFLAGYDQRWSKWTSDHKKEYSNLLEGQYCFSVKAQNIYDHESEIASFHFVISPPWHRTAWAYSGYAVLLLVLFIALFIMHRKRVQHAVFLERKKYETNMLSQEKTEKYLDTLFQYMENSKPFLNPELTLTQLAEDLNIQRNYLSQLVNDKLNMNFNDFINKYRIEAVKKRLVDKKEEETNIMDILLDAGFNSKSSFNRAFKKHTGLTPSQYKKKAKASAD